MRYVPVPSNDVDAALDHLRKGGRLVVRTYTRVIIVDRKTLLRFEAAGAWLLRAEGEGYRLRSGKSSIYLLPGQLTAESA